MIKRIWILVKLQLTNKSKILAKNSKRIYSYVATRFFVTVLLTVLLGAILYIFKNFLFIPINYYFLIFILIVTQLMSIVSAVASLSTDIYKSKDNQILLTLPANNDEIFISKLVVYYINEFFKNLYFILPFLFSYGIVTKCSISYFINIIPVILILPAIVALVSAFISVIFTIISNYLNKHTWLSFSLTLLTIIGGFVLIYYLVSFIPENIRIVQLYNSFILGLTKFMQAVASYGTVYDLIGRLLNGFNVFLNYGLILGFLLLLFVINYLVSRPLFFFLTSKANELARTKKHTKKERNHKGLFWTFLHKEVTIAKRSPNELLSNYSILISLPFIMYVLNSIYMSMNRSIMGNQLVLIFNILVILVIVATSNTASSVAITTEGHEFVLLKTAPTKTHQVAWAKMAFNFAFTSFLLLISFILFQIALPVFNKTDIWLLFVFVFFINASHILWSFQLDIVNPKLSDYAATGSLSNNHNIAKSLSNGLTLAFFLTIISVILFFFYLNIAWIVLISISILWFVFRFWLFRANLNAYFIDIEY